MSVIAASAVGPGESVATISGRDDAVTVVAALTGGDAPDPAGLVPLLGAQQRTVLRLTPRRTLLHR